ncbi:MAG: hypothetical protein EXS02_07605 [Planctomycetes bacterium]|nr:hypothetical protein [Planctomycetota bacterium]
MPTAGPCSNTTSSCEEESPPPPPPPRPPPPPPRPPPPVISSPLRSILRVSLAWIFVWTEMRNVWSSPEDAFTSTFCAKSGAVSNKDNSSTDERDMISVLHKQGTGLCCAHCAARSERMIYDPSSRSFA